MNEIRLSFEAYKKSTFGGKQDKILSVFQTRVKIYFSEKYILGFNQFLSKGNWGVYTHRGLLEQLSSDMDPRQYARHGHSTTHLPIYLKQAIHEAVDSRNCSARILYADLRRVSILSITMVLLTAFKFKLKTYLIYSSVLLRLGRNFLKPLLGNAKCY